MLLGPIARALEDGALGGRAARVASAVYGRIASRSVVRALSIPRGVRAIGVGGATLGGSGKTPLAIECAVELVRRGVRVAIVGHAHRASPREARIVSPDDAVAEVGDEALVCARALSARATGAYVVVAPTRQRAIDFAATLAEAIVIDGVLQTSPTRLALALLAVDPDEPWGHASALPPCGDLRAPRETLLAAADLVVPVRGGVAGARIDGRLHAPDALGSRRLGLITALARPRRLSLALARAGLAPSHVRSFSDHQPPSPRAIRGGAVDVWLMSPKCHAAMGDPREIAGIPVATLEHRVQYDGNVHARLATLFGPPDHGRACLDPLGPPPLL